MFKKNDERCNIKYPQKRSEIKAYMEKFEGVEFNYEESDREVFYKLRERIGVERNVYRFRQDGIFSPQLYNMWKTFVLDDTFGKDYPGRTPHQILQNLLYYYTSEGDLVVDPMAGGGTTIDVCRLMKRSCLAFDLAPARDDIQPNDILKGIPVKECDFIFLDPPYYKAKEGYVESAFTDSIESFFDAMRVTLQNCYDVLKENGKLAVMLKPMGSHEKGEFEWYDLTLETYVRAKEVGFKIIKRVCAPLSTQQYNALDVSRAKKHRYMLNTLRDIMVFQK